MQTRHLSPSKRERSLTPDDPNPAPLPTPLSHNVLNDWTEMMGDHINDRNPVCVKSTASEVSLTSSQSYVGLNASNGLPTDGNESAKPPLARILKDSDSVE